MSDRRKPVAIQAVTQTVPAPRSRKEATVQLGGNIAVSVEEHLLDIIDETRETKRAAIERAISSLFDLETEDHLVKVMAATGETRRSTIERAIKALAIPR